MRTTEKSAFSEIVKKARKQCGWTQAKLAELLGVDANTVSRWERGEHILKEAEIIEKLCQLFQMTPEALGLLEEKPFFFLSYVQSDSVFAQRLTADLQCRGITICDEKLNTTERQEALRILFRKAQAMILVASADIHLSTSIREELELAQRTGCPVYILWRVGRRRDTLAARQVAVCSINARDAHYTTALDELVMALKMLTRQQSTFAPRNPYKGLSPFHSEDVRDFFGRERLIDNLADKLEAFLAEGKTEGEVARLLSVVGPSGSGKSSVVMAGLLPRLRADEIPGSEQWVYLPPMTPGEHPLEALALAVAAHLKERSHRVILQDLWDKGTRGLHLLAKQLTKQQETKVVLVVDQFEELFARVTDEQERRQFIDLLATASREPDGSIIVILMLRADCYDRVMLYPRFYQLFQAHLAPVLPMEKQELRQVIEKPASLPDVSMKFEGDLINDILSGLEGQSEALPLLEFTLDQLFYRREGYWLTQQAYQIIGEVKGAVAKHAESIYVSLPTEEHRALARTLFLRLIDPGTTEKETTRRRARFSELSLPDGRQNTTLRQVVDAFIAARLLTTKEITGITTVEVSHEALIREWIRLSAWLHEAREDIHLQQALSKDVAEWEQRGRPKDRLYRGTQLDEALAWATRNQPSIDEVNFLHESVAERDQQEAVERIRQAQELDLQRRIVRRQRTVIGMMGVTALAIIIAMMVILVLQTQLVARFPPTVTNLNDSGTGSLREAIAKAHSGDAITFAKDLHGTLTLTSGELKIRTNLVISGPGAPVLSISGGKMSRVFFIDSNSVVTISKLTIKDGHPPDFGGGVLNQGTLNLINCVIFGNTAGRYFNGGGISNILGGTLSLTNSIVSGNVANLGGGIDNEPGSTTILSQSVVSDNVAQLGGGGISNGGTDVATKLILTDTTISNNNAPSGGGIANSFGLLDMTRSTVSNNTALAGGGISTLEGKIELANSTISTNRAYITGGKGSPLPGEGGGIDNNGGDISIVFCTIYGNTAGIGGGINNHKRGELDTFFTSESKISLVGSIVAGNHADEGPDVFGVLTLLYPNLVQNISKAIIIFGSLSYFPDAHGLAKQSLLGIATDSGPLQNNGGPTLTHALLKKSRAIDQIPARVCRDYGIFTDQRGMKRPDRGETTCDIGAYEFTD